MDFTVNIATNPEILSTDIVVRHLLKHLEPVFHFWSYCFTWALHISKAIKKYV